MRRHTPASLRKPVLEFGDPVARICRDKRATRWSGKRRLNEMAGLPRASSRDDNEIIRQALAGCTPERSEIR